MSFTRSKMFELTIAMVVIMTVMNGNNINADQGCPFDNGSCQVYCNQQSCGLGYCGHFAWIQCICRKCGDEWSYYDKIRFTNGLQNKTTVNQTELESIGLKLEPQSAPLPMIVVATNNINGTTSDTIQTELITFDTIDDGLTDGDGAAADIQLQLNTNNSSNSSSSVTSTETSNELASGTLLVPDLTEMTTDTDNNNNDDNDDNTDNSNEIDGTDTDKLLEMAERHYNNLKQQQQNATTITTETTPAPSTSNQVTNNKRKRNIMTLNEVRSMMYRI